MIPGKIAWPLMVICIAYQPTFDQSKVYHTSYILDLFWTDPVTKLPRTDYKIGEDIPAKQLYLRLDSQSPIKAD